jgi:integrase
MKKVVDGVTVYPKHGRYWVVVISLERSKTGRHKRVWVKLSRIDAGEQALRDALAAWRNPAPEKGEFEIWTAKFRADYASEVAPTTRANYDRWMNALDKGFGKARLRDIDGDLFQTWLREHYSEARSQGTQLLGRMHDFYDFVVRKRKETGIEYNPIVGVKFRGPQKRKGRFTPAIWWAMHDALDPMGRAFFLLTYYCHMRPTEIRLLREGQLKSKPGYINFTPTKTIRLPDPPEVYKKISPEIEAALDLARSARPSKKVVEMNAYLIQKPSGGPYSTSGLNDLWLAGRTKAGIKVDVTTRDIRPYSLHGLKDMGVDLEQIAVSAGHRDEATTVDYLRQYAKLLSEERLLPPKRGEQ